LLAEHPWIVPIPVTTKRHRLSENNGAEGSLGTLVHGPHVGEPPLDDLPELAPDRDAAVLGWPSPTY